VIGCSTGARFTRDILVHAARALPRVLAGIIALIAVCGGLGYALAMLPRIDRLTAFLDTSPDSAIGGHLRRDRA
jgi:uncharacterized membrane protein AbrB (regulator of aidB expression)